MNIFPLNDAKSTNILKEQSYLNDSNEKLLENNTKIRQAKGIILYLATNSRPDISATVNLLSWKIKKSTEADWKAEKG